MTIRVIINGILYCIRNKGKNFYFNFVLLRVCVMRFIFITFFISNWRISGFYFCNDFNYIEELLNLVPSKMSKVDYIFVKWRVIYYVDN